MRSAQDRYCRSNTPLVSKDAASLTICFPVTLFTGLVVRLNSARTIRPAAPFQQHAQPCPRVPASNLFKTPFQFTAMATKEVQEPTLHPPPRCFQPLLASPADRGESNLTAPVQLKRHAVELSPRVFAFHPNHSSGKERDSLPAEFPVPKRSPSTVKAVICILQLPSVEQSSSVLNTSLSLLSLPAVLPATRCSLQPCAYCVAVISALRVQQLKSN